MNTARVGSPERPRRNTNAVMIAVISLIVIGGLLIIANRRDGDDTAPAADPVSTTTIGAATSTPAETRSTDTPTASANVAVDTAAPAPTATEAPTTATPTVAPTTAATPTTPAPGGTEPLLFWNNQYVGHWNGPQFMLATSDGFSPDWVRGATVRLRNHGGVSYDGSALECIGKLVLSPQPGSGDDYWFSDGAPIAVSTTNDDRGLAAMNEELAARGIDPATVGSYGAPLAADGSADRLLWYPKDTGPDWVATFDQEARTFTNIEGEPGVEADYDIGVPSASWIDLNNDGNLESHMLLGDQDWIFEWSSGQSVWSAGPDSCGY